MSNNIYFDNAASTPISPKIALAMKNMYEKYYGNPSAIHKFGNDSKQILEEARQRLADYFNVDSKAIVFNSGATEGNNYIIKGLAESKLVNRIITSKIEHKSITEVCSFLESHGIEVIYLDTDSSGYINIDELKNIKISKGTLVSISVVNNEVGTIQDYKAISAICKANGYLFHTDAVQGIFNQDIDWSYFDFITITAHKIYGPDGIGATINKNCIPLVPLIHGGGQENGNRSGSENFIGAYELSKAVEMLKKYDIAHIKNMHDYIINNLSALGVPYNVNNIDSQPNIISITFPGFDADTLVSTFSANGIYISSGSACLNNSSSIGSIALYTILKDKNKVRSTIRISLGNQNTIQECNTFIEIAKTVFYQLNNLNKE